MISAIPSSVQHTLAAVWKHRLLLLTRALQSPSQQTQDFSAGPSVLFAALAAPPVTHTQVLHPQVRIPECLCSPGSLVTPRESPSICQLPLQLRGRAATSSSTCTGSVPSSFHRMAFRNVFSAQQLLVQIRGPSYASPYRILGFGLLGLLTGKETTFLTNILSISLSCLLASFNPQLSHVSPLSFLPWVLHFHL